MVSLSLHQRFFIFSSPIFSGQWNKSIIFGLLCLETSCQNCKKTAATYHASRSSVSLAWLLAFTELFAWLVYRVVGLFTMRQTSHANDFVNAKTHARKNLCSQGITAFLWLTSTKFCLLRSKMKCRSHKIDNCHKLPLRQSVMMHPFRPSSIPALFFSDKESLNIYTCYLYFLHQFFFLLW